MRIRVGVRQDAVCAACSHAWYYEQEDERAKLGHAWYMRPAGGRRVRCEATRGTSARQGGRSVRCEATRGTYARQGAGACGLRPRVAHAPGRGRSVRPEATRGTCARCGGAPHSRPPLSWDKSGGRPKDLIRSLGRVGFLHDVAGKGSCQSQHPQHSTTHTELYGIRNRKRSR